MKIIGKTDGGFILESSKGELALVLGIDSPYDDDFKKLRLDVGDEIEVRKINEASEFLRTLDQKRIQNLRGELERMISSLDDASETVNGLTLFDKLKKVEEVES